MEGESEVESGTQVRQRSAPPFEGSERVALFVTVQAELAGDISAS